MANWISIKAAAEKYGMTDGQIRSLMRHWYINFSSVSENEPLGDDNVLMVDTDSIDAVLDFNTVSSLDQLPDDGSVIRIPAAELQDLLRINEECERLQKEFFEEVCIAKDSEAKQRKIADQLRALNSEIIALHLDTVKMLREYLDKEEERFLRLSAKCSE